MKHDREPRAKIPDPIDVGLACDADLNKIWQQSGIEDKSPAERITIAEAHVAQNRPIEPEDSPPNTNN